MDLKSASQFISGFLTKVIPFSPIIFAPIAGHFHYHTVYQNSIFETAALIFFAGIVVVAWGFALYYNPKYPE